MGDALAVLTGLIVGASMLVTPEVQAHLPGGWIWCGAAHFRRPGLSLSADLYKARQDRAAKDETSGVECDS